MMRRLTETRNPCGTPYVGVAPVVAAAATAAAVKYALPIAKQAGADAAKKAKLALDKNLLGPCKWAIGVWAAAYKAQTRTLLDEAQISSDPAVKYALAAAVLDIRQNPTWARRFAGQEKVKAWGPDPTCSWGNPSGTYGPPETAARSIMSDNAHASHAGAASLAGAQKGTLPEWFIPAAAGAVILLLLAGRGTR
jgi:hypothetical protein